jgi:hypothetical protein
MPISCDQRSDVSHQASLWMADYPDEMKTVRVLEPSRRERSENENPVLDITLRVAEQE